MTRRRNQLQKIAVVVALMVALIVVLPGATATTYPAATSVIPLGNPAAASSLGIAESTFRSNCRFGLPPFTSTQDGFVVDLGPSTVFTISSSSSAGDSHALGVQFYWSNCNRVKGFAPLGVPGGDPAIRSGSWTVDGAKWVVVSALYGANVTVNWSMSGP